MLIAGRVGDAPQPPARPVLIYDSSCDFCRRWVDRVRRWDRSSVIDYLPLQEPAASVVSGRPRWALEVAAHVVRPDGVVFAGAAAARELFRYLPGGWLPRALLSLPGALPLAERVYGWIARKYGPVTDERLKRGTPQV